MIKKTALLVLRIVLAGVFIFAGAGKIVHPSKFADQIDNYRMLPYLGVTFMAVVLPWLEVMCGLLLILGKWLRGVLLALSGLNIVFIIAILTALIRGLDISCGCFALPGEAARVGIPRLVEDIILLAISLFLFYYYAWKNQQSNSKDGAKVPDAA